MVKAKSKQPEVSFDCPESDRNLTRAIARRARALLLDLGVDRPAIDIDMDIVATHCNGNPLRLADLLAADDFNFMHDVSKIALPRPRDWEADRLLFAALLAACGGGINALPRDHSQ